MTDTQTIADFVAKHGITVSARVSEHNPATEYATFSGGKFPKQEMDHWYLTLHRKAERGERHVSFHYSTGLGHRKRAEEVPEARRVDVREGFEFLRHSDDPARIVRAKPTAVDLLECLHSDIAPLADYQVGDRQALSDWAEDLGGFDGHLGVAVSTWEEIHRQKRELGFFLGTDLYAEFLACEAE